MSIKEEIKLSVSALRKLNFIFKGKEREKIFNEASFYKSLYSAISDKQILEAVIDKHIKSKIHKIIFLDDEKKIKEYNECLKLFLELEENN
jgi:hypothetical protein